MDVLELIEIVQSGEDSSTQFKEIFSSPDSLAAEIGAFANSRGGRILVGVTDSGEISGLPKEEVSRLNQLISNVCSQKIDPSISVTTENINYGEDAVVVIINIPMGTNKYYLSNGRDVWVKMGADKRRATREEMRRLMQESAHLFADEQELAGTNINDLELNLVKEFVERRLEDKIENLPAPLENVLNNMKIMSGDKCTLGGLLLFGKISNVILNQFNIGAVSWFGNELSGTEYRDSEDLIGNVSKLFPDGMAFLKRQLRRLQDGQGFNSLGFLEIPEVALEEALVNAIVHRNYFVSSNIRLMVFDNRIEIVSPGILPNTLSVESIKTGVHVVRNPILLSHIKDISGIPYRGMGTGISRIIKSCKLVDIKVDFVNENEQGQFKVIFWRKVLV